MAKWSQISQMLVSLALGLMPTEAIAQVFYPQQVPLGDYTFYERNFRKNVSYSRINNNMVGALYDPSQPQVVTCFAATFLDNGVEVIWWENLWQINRPQDQVLRQFYSIVDFTVDNSTPEPGLENEAAVKYCLEAATKI